MLEEIRVPLPDGADRPAVLARPPGEGPFPGVVVIHDLFGMKPDTGRHCMRFAEAGYVAIAPDLYDGGRAGCVVRTVLDMSGRPGKTLPILDAVRRHLAERPDVDADRLGVIGFCMGGAFALLAGADHDYAVAAPFYGAVPKKRERLAGLCPTLAQYGARDRMFASQASRLSAHLEGLGVEHELLVHDGVGHSFMNDHGDDWWFSMGRHTPMRAAYDEQTEAIAWTKVLAFFDAHLPAART